MALIEFCSIFKVLLMTLNMTILKSLKQGKLIFLLIFPFIINAQQYHPFPEDNAFWTVLEYTQNYPTRETYIYTFNGDTTINNLSYKKVFQLNDKLDGQDTIWKLHVFMRQEVDNKKIFFIRHYLGETIEKLGYDFNPEIGDTISLPAFAYEEYDSLFK